MINLDEIMHKIVPFTMKYDGEITNENAKQLMREAIRQALELAANEATVENVQDCDASGESFRINKVSKQSILNVINKVK